MKKIVLMTALIALPLGVTACNKKAEAPATETSANAMNGMAMPAEVKHGKGTGTVTAIDPAKGMITLNHGEIAELQWPAMEMSFAAKPEVLKAVKVGDKVRFDIDWDGKTGTVTTASKQP